MRFTKFSLRACEDANRFGSLRSTLRCAGFSAPQLRQTIKNGGCDVSARPEYIFSYTAQVRLPPEVIGPTPDGIRVNFYVPGGDVH
jgi:hypothetical protein